MTAGGSYGLRPALSRRLAGGFGRLVLAVLVGGFAASALVRYAPGFNIDENTWNPRLSSATVEAMHARRQQENRLPYFYIRYLSAAARGDLGHSETFNTPVSELLRQRAPTSLKIIFWGMLAGLSIGAFLAWAAVWPRSTAAEITSSAFSGFLIAIPPAVLGLAFFFLEAPLSLAVGLALAPRVFGTLRTVFTELADSPALLAARARGVAGHALALRYAIVPALPQFAATVGVAFVIAFGSLIPIEALCDVPGIGQLAWKAALARDLPLLCGLALILTTIVASAQWISELVTPASEGSNS